MTDNSSTSPNDSQGPHPEQTQAPMPSSGVSDPSNVSNVSNPDKSDNASTYALTSTELADDPWSVSTPDAVSHSRGQLSSEQPSLPDGPLENLSELDLDYADPNAAPWMSSEPRPTHPPKSTFLEPEDANPMPNPDSASEYSESNYANQQYSKQWPVSSPNGSPRHKLQGKPKPGFEYAKEDINALRIALKDNNLFRLSFYFLDYILRAQTALFEQIHRQQQLPRIIASMSILCAILSAIYGLTMGMDHSLLQSVAAAIKLPILFVLTAIICIPSLYTFNVLLGQRFKFLQTVTLMVMTLGTTSILLASLAPIAFFFSLTTPQYSFLLLLHVAIFGLCGVYGVQYLYRGCAYLAFRMEQPLNNLLLRIWIVIYALVGMQLGWRLRPFVGSDGSPFQIFRPDQGGNFYIAVWNAISSLFGGG